MFQGQATTLLISFVLLGAHYGAADVSLVQKKAVMSKDLRSKEPDKPKEEECMMAEWGAWGECTKTCASSELEDPGKRVRYRNVEPLNCARSFEEIECPNLPCPVDCVMSQWEEWGTCDKECENDGARQNRTRIVLLQPEHGGLCCPETVECSDKAEPECGPARTVDYKPCGMEKQKCQPSPWSEWSPCSKTCNTGKKTRTRMIETPAKCSGAPCLCDFLEVTNCELVSCVQECELSAWSGWSKCPVTCGGSVQTRSRSVVTAPSGGAPDCGPLDESKNCAVECCNEDCVLSNWEPWTFCSASCYGTQKRTRRVEVTPCGSGEPCGSLFESRECNHDCVLNCEVGEWAPWSKCSATCGGGSKMRSRAITQQEANGGTNCPPLWEVACCDDSNMACPSSTTSTTPHFEIEVGVSVPSTTSTSTTSTGTTSSTSTTSTGTTPKVYPGLCFAFGDPHFITFDGPEAMFRSTLNYWLVHSAKVHIQGMSIGKYGMQRGIAIGGPFMKGHKLIAFLDGAADLMAFKQSIHPIKVAWDGKEILTKDGDVVKEQDVCELHRHPAQTMVLDDAQIDKLDGKHEWWHENFKSRWNESVQSVYHFKFAGNVEIFLASYSNLEVVIKMPPQANQAGYCGNFNEDPDDDAKPADSEDGWPTATGEKLDALEDDEDLFKEFGNLDGVEFKPDWKTSSMIQAVKDETCPEELKKKAEHFCHQIPEKSLHSGCVYDICATNQTAAADAAFIMEVLKVKYGRNVVEFDGHGRCLDQDDSTFSSLTAQGDLDKDGCIALVERAVGVKGLQGAQIQSEGPPGSPIKCQILMDPDMPVEAELPGQWGNKQVGQGKGIVSGGSGEEGWNCWIII